MDLSLTGKRAVICGSTQGIGLAAATELALLGADCILLARNENGLKEAVKQLSVSGNQRHQWFPADFSYPETVQKAIQQIVADGNVHILVNNSGGPKAGPILDALPEAFEAAFRQHIVCNQLLAQAVVPGMRSEKYGRIINITSTSVKTPLADLGVSNTIRLAVAAWSKTLANEIGQYNITVNNILPGLTSTRRLDDLMKHSADKADKKQSEVEDQIRQTIPMKRFGKPEEIGAVIAFLASPAAAYISGTNIAVDGGRTAAL